MSGTFSEEAAARVANTFRTHFGMRLDVKKDAHIWRESLADAGMTDENAAEALKGFIRSWQQVPMPRLHNFCRWVARWCAAQPVPASQGRERPAAPVTRTPEEIAHNKTRGSFKERLLETMRHGGRPPAQGQGVDVPEGEIPF